MKVLVIFEVEENTVINSHCGDNKELIENCSLENAIEQELGWVEESGIYVKNVICQDSIPPNDADLGNLIRENLK